ncbi:MAG: hypothetical protein GF330_13110 [Candidatus Eisenbacteria bacterium]|nr:hypothetical protein [Candidatus Eisenbacteria bacterium]
MLDRHTAMGLLTRGAPLLALLLSGCSSGTLFNPEETPASWEYLRYYTSPDEETLLVENGGSFSIQMNAGIEEVADLGLLAPSAWQALRTAATEAELPPIELVRTTGAPGASGVSLVRLREGGRLWGISWIDDGELSAAQRDLIALLDGIREAALSSEDVDAPRSPVETILRGRDASYEDPRVALVRDEDTLLALIDEALPGGVVVLPRVDFAREMVVAVFMGWQRPGSDLAPTGNAYRTQDGDLAIPLRFTETEGPCPRSTGPYAVLRLPRMESDIFFVRERSTAPCEGGGE